MNEEFIIRKLLKSKIKGVDNYKHNGSTWLIFTSEKKWVIELTPQGTLWYNYYFFSEIFNFVGLDVIENQHIITEWVEETIINPVKKTRSNQMDEPLRVEDTIQNGVKHTEYADWEDGDERLDDIIKNGVKETTHGGYLGFVEKKVKKIHQFETAKQLYYVEDVIDNGVKETNWRKVDNYPIYTDNVIERGEKC